MKKTHKLVLVWAAAALVLCAAFWYGGGAPGLQGWRINQMQQEHSPISAPSDPAVGNISADFAPAPTSPDPVPTPPITQPAQPPQPPPPAPAVSSQPDQPPDELEASCTVSISCAAVLDNLDWLDADKQELIPPDGTVFAPTRLSLEQGDTAFSLLQRLAKQEGLHLEASFTPGTGSAYVEGIANLYEFDCGQRSGWLYLVNGVTPGYSSSEYTLTDADVVQWVYTCTLGEEAGG